jgi:Tol biopolymer transport system component
MMTCVALGTPRTRHLCVVTALAALGACCGGGHPPPAPSVVLTYVSPMWYEETGRYFRVSLDGQRAIYGQAPRLRFYDLATAREVPASTEGTRVGGTKAPPFEIPPSAIQQWSSDGARLAYFMPGDAAIAIATATATAPTLVRLDGSVTGLSWTPAGDSLYATALHPTGLTSLAKIVPGGATTIVKPALDASPSFNGLAFSADGHTLFLALASDGVPDDAVRHDPEAPHRDLDIYALALDTGALRVVVSESGDDCCPAVAAGSLYWTHNDPTPEVVVFPMEGGDPHPVADHGFLPRWRPDGRQIAFTRAYYRLADYGLDMDGWVVDLDDHARAVGRPRSWIAGYGEDMGPVWSPDGRWVAYHSHRSATAVPLYESPGRTDDTWLMRTAGGPEIRLTDFGYEVGPPDWSPDGRRIVFDSWDKAGAPRFAKPWIITIDPATGRSLGAKRMPLPPDVKGIAGEAWSPTGAEIAFIERIDDTRRALWVSRPDGGDARRLTAFASATIGGVAWTPDGRELLYSALAGDRMQIFAIARDGGAPRQLTRGDANLMHPSVSPNGAFVAASRIAWRKELRRVTLP